MGRWTVTVEYEGQELATEVDLRPDPAPDGRLLLEFKKGTSHETSNDDGSSLPLDRERQRLGRAVSWILSLDARAGPVLLRGGVVSRRLEATSPPPLPAPGPGEGFEVYSRLRVPAATLVRPLFFPAEEPSSLFPYQQAGVQWLLDNDAGILADDMGLGKTVQAITACRRLVEAGEARDVLVIAPRSLLATWEDELTKWAPDLTRLRVLPPTHHRDKVWSTILGRVHVIITSYEQVRSLPEPLADHTFDIVIADEAHRIRNLHAFTTRGVRRLKWRRFWALTGTPIERDPIDFLTILSTLEPSRFSVRDAQLPPEVIRARARPYVLRRLKSDVMDELPEVIDSKEPLELLPAQAKAYARALEGAYSTRPDSPGLLEIINQLRTICDYDPETQESVKVERITEIIGNIRDAGEKCVVFSYLIKPLDLLAEKVGELYGEAAFVRLEGSMDLAARSASIEAFKKDANVVVLLASSRIGGEGLTLTEANHVIFFNEWWNPSANAQARDRVVRIGQRRGVRVYRFRCRNTIEDSLEMILTRKESTFAEVVDKLVDPGFASDKGIVQLVDELRGELVHEDAAGRRPSGQSA